MGFFSIRGEELPEIIDQVWFPKMESASERTRILNQPGMDQRLKAVRARVDAEVMVFEVNKTVKGPHGKVAAGRPGIVAQTSDAAFEVHLPIQRRPFDIGSIATQVVEFTTHQAEYHEEAGNLGHLAVARAIKAYVNNDETQ